MRYFATVSKSSSNSQVEEKVLASNPITEVGTLCWGGAWDRRQRRRWWRDRWVGCLCVVLAHCSSRPLRTQEMSVAEPGSLFSWDLKGGWGRGGCFQGSPLPPAGLEILPSDCRSPLFTFISQGKFPPPQTLLVHWNQWSSAASGYQLSWLLNIQE